MHELRRAIEEAFTAGGGLDGRPLLRATVVSFGYKYGLPVDADLVVDVRFLPNPFWIPELRELTGEDDEVRDYVLAQEGAEDFLDRYTELLEIIGAGYTREGKHYLTLAVGCTGGKHRRCDGRAVRRAAAGDGRAGQRRQPRSRAGVACRSVDDWLPARSPGSAGGSSRSAAATVCTRRLSALRLLTDDLTAVVTVADDGGSSGPHPA